jgi:hypothetical protein
VKSENGGRKGKKRGNGEEVENGKTGKGGVLGWWKRQGREASEGKCFWEMKRKWRKNGGIWREEVDGGRKRGMEGVKWKGVS